MVECSVCGNRIPDDDEVLSFCDCRQYVCEDCQPHGCPPQTFDDAAAEIAFRPPEKWVDSAGTDRVSSEQVESQEHAECFDH